MAEEFAPQKAVACILSNGRCPTDCPSYEIAEAITDALGEPFVRNKLRFDRRFPELTGMTRLEASEACAIDMRRR